MTERFARYPKDHLLNLINLESRDLLAILSFAVMSGLLSLATPVAVQSLVNTIAFGILIQPLIVLMLILLGCLAINSVLYSLQVFVAEMIQRRILVRLVSQSIRNLSHALADTRIEERMGWVNYYFEIMTLQKAGTNLLLDGLSYGLQTIIGLFLLAFYHPVLLAFDVLIIASLYLIFTVLGKTGVVTAIEKSKAKHEIARWMQEIATNSITSKLAWEWIWQRSDDLTRDYLNKSEKSFRIVFKQQVSILALYALANSALLGLGGWMVIERQLTLGQLIAAELILNAMLSGLTRLGKSITSYYDLMAGMDKISFLIDLPSDADESAHWANFETKSLSGRQLHIPEPQWKHLSTGMTNLEDFELRMGDSAHVLTESDQETEALLELLRGHVMPQKGSLMINDIDFKTLHNKEINDRIAIAFKPEWFEVSVLENLTMGQTGTVLEHVHQFVRDFPVFRAVENLPTGLDSPLSRNGYPLNAEHLWQINLIRALLASRDILIIGLPSEAQLWSSIDEIITEAIAKTASRMVIWVTTFSHPQFQRMKNISIGYKNRTHDSEALTHDQE